MAPNAISTMESQSTPPRGASQKSLAAAANLTNLLPTGTVLIFQALVSSFTNNGDCRVANKYLIIFAIGFCSLICIFSCFTDSFIGKKDGQLYYGIATFKGLHVFNDMDSTDGNGQEELSENDKENYRIKWVDFVHVVGSLAVFWAFAFSSYEVENCLFANPGPNAKELIKNLPLGVGVLGSFVFSIFPSNRKGIGYAGRAPQAQRT